MTDNHKYIYRYCAVCGYPAPVRLYCGDRLCPLCKQPHYYRLIRRYVPVIKGIPAYRLSQLTLTFTNFAFLTKSKVRYAESCVRRLRQTRWFKEKCNGGLAVYEVKHVSDEKGWNLHCHILINSSYIPKKELSEIWRSITGDSFIVDVRKEENNKRAVFHLLKYFLKNPVIQGNDVSELKRQYNSAFFGSRNIVSFGSLYNSGKDDYQMECPVCKSKDFIEEYKLNGYRNMAMPAYMVGAG